MKSQFEQREGDRCAYGSVRTLLPGPQADLVDLTQLYVSHGRYIRAHCGRMLGDLPSAEDATHEVFLRVGRCVGRLPPPGEVRAWLFRIATNYCLNELRSRRVRAEPPPQLVQLPSDPQDALAASNDARRLLARLPARVRDVAVLTFVEGMLQHEVAAELGVSRRTVVSCLSRVKETSAYGIRPLVRNRGRQAGTAQP